MINRQMEFFLVTMFIATLVQSNVAIASEQPSQWRKVNDTTLQFIGEITPETERDFFLALTEEIDTLIVTSPGGHVRPAVTVGVEIARRDMTVIVRQMCLSSCANYFFLAADTKIIEKGSIVGFHGSATSQDLESYLAEITENARIAGNPFLAIYNLRNSVSDSVLAERMLEQRLADIAGFDIQILSDTTGRVTLDPGKYDFGLDEAQIFFWPSADVMRQCYSVEKITDLARPSEQMLQDYVEEIAPGSNLVVLGDDYLPRCKAG